MIHVLSLHPSFDKHLNVDNFIVGGLNSYKIESIRAAGKGLNVSRVVAQLGGESVLWLLLGNENSNEYLQQTKCVGMAKRFFEAPGRVRENLKIFDPVAGKTTEVNGIGAELTDAIAREIEIQLSETLAKDDVLVISGSLPPGAKVEWLRALIEKGAAKGCLIIADTSGPALEGILDAGVSLIKPNRDEFLELLKLPGDLSNMHLFQMVRQEIRNDWPSVLLSVGEQGLVFVNRTMAFRAFCPAGKVLNTTGAGDALVGAMAVGLHAGGADYQVVSRAIATASVFVEKLAGNELSLEEVKEREPAVQVIPL